MARASALRAYVMTSAPPPTASDDGHDDGEDATVHAEVSPSQLHGAVSQPAGLTTGQCRSWGWWRGRDDVAARYEVLEEPAEEAAVRVRRRATAARRAGGCSLACLPVEPPATEVERGEPGDVVVRVAAEPALQLSVAIVWRDPVCVLLPGSRRPGRRRPCRAGVEVRRCRSRRCPCRRGSTRRRRSRPSTSRRAVEPREPTRRGAPGLDVSHVRRVALGVDGALETVGQSGRASVSA